MGRVAGSVVLDGARVPSINSRLRAGEERNEVVALRSNADLAFKGATLYGAGFIVDRAGRDALVSRDARNGQRILPYLGGAEVNTNPTQAFEQYAIYLTDLSLAEAERWPDLLGILREKVKPERDKMGGYSVAEGRKENWWKYGTPASELRAALGGMTRCLVTARVTKHLCFSFQNADRLFNDKLYVFPFDTNSPFAVLQSRTHAAWTWLLSSTLEERLNYSASDCFDTFPFPQPDPRTVIPPLEDIGKRLYDARARYMVETEQGLTQTYNKLKDPDCHDGSVVELRRLHEEMDRAVIDAYGWKGIEVPPFCPSAPTEQKALEAFQDEVIDRLFVLNAERAAEEQRLGLGDGKKGKQKGRAKKTKPRAESAEQRKLDLE